MGGQWVIVAVAEDKTQWHEGVDLFQKNIEKKHLCGHDMNYYYFSNQIFL